MKAVLQFGTMRKAAESLFVSESSISQSIHLLEEDLGFKLFERTSRKIRLTPEGQKLLPYIDEILLASDAFENVVRDIRDPTQGTVTLGIVPSLALTLLPDIISTLKSKLPRVIVEVHEGGSIEILQDIADQKIDIGLVAAPHTPTATFPTKNLKIDYLFESTLEPVVATNHPLARKPTVTTSDLARQSLVLFRPGYIVRDIVLSTLPAEPKPNVMYSADNTESMRNIIRLGAGVCLLPTFLLDHWSHNELTGLHRLSAVRSLFPVKVISAYRAPRFMPGFFQDFVAIIHSRAKKLEPPQ